MDRTLLKSHVKREVKVFADLAKEKSSLIQEGINAFAEAFVEHGTSSPPGGQFDSALQHGLPGVPPLVRALLFCELTNGVLMGVQDADKLVGDLTLRRAQENTSFEGMGGNVTTCAPGDLLVSDGAGVVASLFQGPDQRTRVGDDTVRPIFYVFSVPNLGEEQFEAGIETAKNVLPWTDVEVVRCLPD